MNDKKKIMLLSCKDNTFYNFRAEMILKLKEIGFEVVLVCPYGEKIDYFTDKGFRFIDLPMKRRSKNPFEDLKLYKAYKKLLKQERPDVVLTYTSKPSIYGGYACGKLKIPYIANDAGLMASGDKLLDRLVTKMSAVGEKKAACVMYQNPEERDVMNRYFKNKVHYRLIPGSGVNLEHFAFEPYPESEDKIVFDFVARIMQSKGIEEYLKCAEIVHAKHPNTEFRIFGAYDDDTYKAKIDELDKTGVVKYMGVQLNMRPFIKECHAAIHPSYYEGMTNVVLEHSASGRPCIGSNVAGVRDGIDDGKTGYVFEVKNVDSMVEAVEKFLSISHEQKVAMGIAARKKMEDEFDRNIVTNVYIEEINKILEKQK